MTSNAGAEKIVSPKKLGFSSGNDKERSYEDMKKLVMDEVKQIFRPEFLNRIDDIIVFHPLDEENIKDITKLMLNETAERVSTNMGIPLTYTDELVSYIAKEGYDPLYGARPLRRAIQNQIEDELAEAVLSGKIKEGDVVEAGIVDKKVVFEKNNRVCEKETYCNDQE
jgi:ATP-dependent Clp protease ATP-binding subunit ClpC